MTGKPDRNQGKRTRNNVFRAAVNVFFAVSLVVSLMPLPGYAATGDGGNDPAAGIQLSLRAGDPSSKQSAENTGSSAEDSSNAKESDATGTEDGSFAPGTTNAENATAEDGAGASLGGNYVITVGEEGEIQSEEEPSTWTVSFDLNADDPEWTPEPLESIDALQDKDVVLMPEAPEREGYRFVGWNTLAEPASIDALSPNPGRDGIAEMAAYEAALPSPDEANAAEAAEPVDSDETNAAEADESDESLATQEATENAEAVVAADAAAAAEAAVDAATEAAVDAATEAANAAAYDYEAKDADPDARGHFIPAGTLLYNLSYYYVVTEDGEAEIVGDDVAAVGHDGEGRKVFTCDLAGAADEGKLTVYALWVTDPDNAKSDEGEKGDEPEQANDGQPATDKPAEEATEPESKPESKPEPKSEPTDPTLYIAPGDPLYNDDGTEPEEITDSVAAELSEDLAAAYSDDAVEAANAKADASNAAVDKAIATLDNARGGVNLFGLRLGAQDEPQFDVESTDRTRIGPVTIHWLTPDTSGSAYTGDATRLSLVPGNDSQQVMQFQFEFSLSGEDDYEPGAIEFSIPQRIWRDANGNPIGYLTLSVPEEPADGADFAYRLVNGNYIVTNVHRLDPACRAAFQFTIRGITPHLLTDAVIPVLNQKTGEIADYAGKTVALKTAGGYEPVDAATLSEEQLRSGDYYIIDNYVSDLIQPTLTVTLGDGTVLGKKAESGIDATIDTAERIAEATKSAVLYENAPSSLPDDIAANLPEGTTKDDYVFVRWQTYVRHSGNQAFSLSATEKLGQAYADNGNGTRTNIDGYLLGSIDPNGRAQYTRIDDTTIQIDHIWDNAYHEDTTYRYDHLQYVWSAYPKEQLPEGGTYYFPNTVDWALDGAQDGTVTHAPATAQAVYTPRPFVKPTGRFWSNKWIEGVNKTYSYGYALDSLRAGNDLLMNFHLNTYGYILPFTLKENATAEESKDLANYGQRPVHFEMVDDATWFANNFSKEVTSADFQVDSVRVSRPTQTGYAKDEAGNWGYRGDSGQPTPDVTVWVHTDGTGERETYSAGGTTVERDVIEWGEPYATVSWASGSAQITYADGSTAKGDTVKFPNNVTDYRVAFDSAAAYAQLDIYPVVRLRASAGVKAIIDDLFERYADSEAVISTLFQNDMYAESTYYDLDTQKTFLKPDYATARLQNTTLSISSDKSSYYNQEVDNDVNRKRVTIHYTARVHEQTNIENLAQYRDAVAADIIPADTSCTWYDLLPIGVMPITSSVKLRNGDTVKRVRTVPDWRNTGRVMLIVEADLQPQPFRENSKVLDRPTIKFDAYYTWDDINKYGTSPVNRIVYESGVTGTHGTTVIDGTFGNVKNWRGEPDNPLAGNNNLSRNAVGEDAALLTDLDPNTNEGRFVYASSPVHLTGDFSVLTQLTKQVRDDSKSLWTHGKELDGANGQVTVYPGHPYTYRIQAESSVGTTTKDMVLYDSVEWYKPQKDDDAVDIGHQQWRGILRSIDVSEFEELGAAPMVYYSTKPEIVLYLDKTKTRVEQREAVKTGDYVITDTDIWTPASEYEGDLADVTAFAVDISKKPDGSEFELEEGKRAAIYVHMVAPVDDDLLYGGADADGKDLSDQDGVDEGGRFPSADNPIFAAGLNKDDPANNRYAYNSACLVCSQWQNGTRVTYREPIDNPYTRVGILPHVVQIKKLWNDANDNDGKRPETVTLHLWAQEQHADGTLSEPTLAQHQDDTLVGEGETGDIVLTPDEDGNWTARLEHVKAVSDNVNYVPLLYSVTEDNVPGYRVLVQEGDRNASGSLVSDEGNWFTIVNKHEKEQMLIPGQKIWDDEQDKEGKRPSQVEVKLFADGKLKSTKIVNAGPNNLWRYSFGPVDKYKNGREIVYTVEETPVPKYVDSKPTAEQIEAGTSPYSIINTYHPLGNLSIQKDIKNTTDVSAQKEFTFTVLLTAEKVNPTDEDQPLDGEYTYYVYELDENGDPVTETTTEEDPDTGETVDTVTPIVMREGKIQSGGQIKLKGGERAVIVDLPSETTYQIAEESVDGFTNTKSSGTEGTVLAGREAAAKFENTYAAQGGVQINAKKELKGHALARYQFSFRLATGVVDPDTGAVTAGKDLRSASCAIDGTAAFGQIRYTEADHGKTYHYVVHEVDTGKPGYIYSAARYDAAVTVTDNGDGTMSTSTVYTEIDPETGLPVEGAEESAEPPVFVNEYHAKGEIVLRAWKDLPGRVLKDGEFTFELRDGETGKVIQTKKNTADGSVAFDAIKYDETDLMEVDEATGEVTYLPKKEYLYTVNEVVGNDPTVEYDTSFKGYLVTVFDNDDGTLSVAQGNVDVSGRYIKCANCEGTGFALCPTCMGTGANSWYHIRLNLVTGGDSGTHTQVGEYPTCSTCHGLGAYVSGEHKGEECADCAGTGLSYAPGWLNSTEEGVSYRVVDGLGMRLRDASFKWRTDIDRPVLIKSENGVDTMRYYLVVVRPCETCEDACGHVDCDVCEGAGYILNPDWEMPDTEADLPVFKNKLRPGNLSVTKLTDGTGNPDQEFKFRVELEGEKLPNSLDYTIEKATGDSGGASSGDSAGGTSMGGQSVEEEAAESEEPAASEEDAVTQDDAPDETVSDEPADQAQNPASGLADAASSFFGVEKAYAAGNATSYAVLQNDGTLLFFLSENTYSNNTTAGPFVDIAGNSYTGRCFTLATSGAPSWDSYRTSIVRVKVAENQPVKPTTMANWFRIDPTNTSGLNNDKLVEVDLRGLDTSGVTAMNYLFGHCRKLRSVNMLGLDMSHVTNLGHTFVDCPSLTEVGCADWDLSSTSSVDNMFSGDIALTHIDTGNWKIPNAHYMHNMFYGCRNLSEVDVSGWNIGANGTEFSMGEMFYGCSSLTGELDLSGWKTTGVVSMNGMFEGCSGITRLNISGFDTGRLNGNTSRRDNVAGTTQYYSNSRHPYNFENGGGTYRMFSGMTSLQVIVLGPDFAFKNTTNSGLPNASSTSPYTGKWMNETNPDIESKTASELMSGYTSTMAGTWVWETPPTSYILHFEKNNEAAGGSIADQKDMAIDQDETINPQGQFYEYGKKVGSWNTAADGSGTSYEYNGIIPAGTYPASYKPVTLYAQWVDDVNSATLENGAFEITLRAGYTATFDPLPAGTAYRVYEQTPDGWILVSQVNAAGVIQPLETANAKFENSYQPATAQAQFFATKTLDNQPAADGKFTFELRDEAGKLLQTKQNGAGGFVSFDALSWEEDDLVDEAGDPVDSKDFTYTISEVVGDDDTITYDAHTQNVTVKVTKKLEAADGGSSYVLKAEVSYDGVQTGEYPEFVNTTKPGMLSLSKTTVNATPANEDTEFEFTIRLSNANGMPLGADTVSYYVSEGESADAGENAPGGEAPDNGSALGGQAAVGEEAAPMKEASAAKDTKDLAAVDEARSAERGTGGLLDLLSVEKAYANDGQSRVFHATPDQLQGVAYAVFDETDGSLVFFRAPAGTYSNGQVDGSKTYYTGFEEYKTKDYDGRHWYRDEFTWWKPKRSLIKSVRVEDGCAIRPNVMYAWFAGCDKLTSVDLRGIDTSRVTGFACTFNDATALENLDVSTLDFSKARTTFAMFQGAKKLKSIDMSGADLSSLLETHQMFYMCSNIERIDFAGCTTPKLVYCNLMFGSCTNLKYLDVSDFDVRNVETLSAFFSGLSSITAENLEASVVCVGEFRTS